MWYEEGRNRSGVPGAENRSSFRASERQSKKARKLLQFVHHRLQCVFYGIVFGDMLESRLDPFI